VTVAQPDAGSTGGTPATGTTPATGARRWAPLPPSRWTLRARLVVIVVALLATVGIVIGTVSVLALDAFLTGQLADQVRSAAARSQGAAGPGDDDAGGPGRSDGHPKPDFLLAPGQAAGTAGVRVEDGRVTDQAMIGADGQIVRLASTSAQALAATPVDGAPHRVHLADEGEYLALAVRTADGDTVVTALPLTPVQATAARLALVVALVTLCGVAAAGVAGTLIVRAALRPLARTAAAAGRVAELPLERGDVALDVRALGVAHQAADPRTEVGRVDAALSRMLEHIAGAFAVRQASEARMRRFVSDASHELRTPLASIRGYAELTRRTSCDLPPDVAHAIRRVESEAQRMTGLVEELLLLARLDEKRPLRSEETDLSGLVVDAVADAHAAGADHRWLLDLPDEPVTVDGDQARLHQVVANLLANARVHTPAGTTVQVAVRTGSDDAADGGSAGSDGGAPRTAVVEVVDDGPGIAPALLPDVFARFTRGDSSRGRSAGGTGLGLAIVAGVVEAHGGRVDVESEPGRTAFRVVLPAGPARVLGHGSPVAVSGAVTRADPAGQARGHAVAGGSALSG
jgi:two-component system OmpR family sensor kinase